MQKQTTKEKPVAALPIAPVKKGRRSLVLLVVSSVVGLAVAGAFVVAIGAFSAHWDTPVVFAVSRFVPIPAAVVSGHWNSYYRFLDAVHTLDYSFDQPDVLRASGFTVKPSRQELEMLVLDRMVKDDIVQQLAKSRGVNVTTTDLDAEMKKLVDQTGDAKQVEARIQQLYRWDLVTFRNRVIQPYLLRQRLQENIAADDSLNTSQMQRIQSVLERVKSGKEDFQAIAREVNEDVTKSADGDLGVFGRGEREQPLEEAAFSLDVGETSGMVRTNEGLHILKLLEKVPATDTESEKVHVAHIFIAAKQLDEWLFEQVKNHKVRILLSGFRWDAVQARVVATNANLNANSSATNATPQ